MEYPKFKKSSPYVNDEEIEAEESDQQMIEQSVNVQPLIQLPISLETSSMAMSNKLSSAKVKRRYMYHPYQQLNGHESRQHPTVQAVMEQLMNVQALIQPTPSIDMLTAAVRYQQIQAFQLAQQFIAKKLDFAGFMQQPLIQPSPSMNPFTDAAMGFQLAQQMVDQQLAVADLGQVPLVASQQFASVYAYNREQTPESSSFSSPNDKEIERQLSKEDDDEPLDLTIKKNCEEKFEEKFEEQFEEKFEEKSVKKCEPKVKKYKKYSDAQRRRAILLVFEGVKVDKAAKICNIPSRTLYQKLKEIRDADAGYPQRQLQDEPQGEMQQLTN